MKTPAVAAPVREVPAIGPRGRFERWTRALEETDRLRGDRNAAIVLASLAVFMLGKVLLVATPGSGYSLAAVAGAALGALLARGGLRVAGVTVGAASSC